MMRPCRNKATAFQVDTLSIAQFKALLASAARHRARRRLTRYPHMPRRER